MRYFFALLGVLASSLALSAPVAVSVGHLVDVKDGSQLAFDLSSAAVFHDFILENPRRLVLDIKNARLRDAQPLANLHSLDISNVRSGQKGKDLRIVIELPAPLRTTTTLLAQSGQHLVIDVFRNPVAAPPVPVAAAPMPVDLPPIEMISQRQLPPPTAPDKQEIAVKAEAQTPKSADPISTAAKITPPATLPAPPLAIVKPSPDTVIQPLAKAKTEIPAGNPPQPSSPALSQTPDLAPLLPVRRRDFVVVIDPGHGGQDSGAIGARGTMEKNITLAVARRLKNLVDSEPGMRAILTRNSDIYLHLPARVAFARRHDADLFISIHADSYPESNARGSSVFILSTRGASSTKARWLANKENAADLIGGVTDTSVTPVVFDILHEGVIKDSMDVANITLRHLGGIGRIHKNQVQRAGFAVLKAPDIPSILVETAFISDPWEELKLRSPQYQQQIAGAIIRAVRTYARQRPAAQDDGHIFAAR